MHPNGFIAWALACGSEDLHTFDVNDGLATDVVGYLPAPHPVGLTLDDTGQGVFVVADQSHTLLTFDTDGGSLIGHTQLYTALPSWSSAQTPWPRSSGPA